MEMFSTVSYERPPPLGQMVGGATTDSGGTYTRSVIFVVTIADPLHVPKDSGLPLTWSNLLLDSFGYLYYRHIGNGIDMRTHHLMRLLLVQPDMVKRWADQYGYQPCK